MTRMAASGTPRRRRRATLGVRDRGCRRVIASPFAKKGFVDHTPYDTTSILQFISKRFGLPMLPGIRTQLGDLRNAFEFDQ